MKTLISSLIALAFTLNGLYSCTSNAEPMPNRAELTVPLDGAELIIKIKATSFDRLDAVRRLVIDKLGAKSSAADPAPEPETVEPVETSSFKFLGPFKWISAR